jgi:hypothetical protein
MPRSLDDLYAAAREETEIAANHSATADEEYAKAPFLYLRCPGCEKTNMYRQEEYEEREDGAMANCKDCKSRFYIMTAAIDLINGALGVPGRSFLKWMPKTKDNEGTEAEAKEK